ncbi:MAG: hypothetical protein JRG75_04055 [Deltaproteobacteria bacterium]|nr:hypothetical protein [Deltaproteobacteria bacterium]
MESTDIEKLFFRVLEDSGQDTDAVRQVFSTLVRTTLEYRDRMLSSKGIVVTVEDVRWSLGRLVRALDMGNMPEADNEISLGLLNIWVRELKP